MTEPTPTIPPLFQFTQGQKELLGKIKDNYNLRLAYMRFSLETKTDRFAEHIAVSAERDLIDWLLAYDADQIQQQEDQQKIRQQLYSQSPTF